MPQTSTDIGKLERTRLKLLDAVRNEIAESGRFTAERVASRAGSSTPTFYNHFANKDAALTAAYELLMGDLVQTVAQKCRIEVLLDKGLRELAAWWIETTAAFFRQNAPLFRLAQAAIKESKPMRAVFRAHEEEIIQLYLRFIERGQAAQLIRRGDARAMAEVLTITAQSWNHPLVQRLQPGSALHHELIETVVRMLQPDESR
ncbi:MAG: TetR/AcrR family transcriptional regulator [Pseudomonadota bacterium]